MSEQGKPVVTMSRENIAISVWHREGERRDGEPYSFYTYSLQVSWKDGDDWKHQSVNLDMRQLLAAVLMLQLVAMKYGVNVKLPEQAGQV